MSKRTQIRLYQALQGGIVRVKLKNWKVEDSEPVHQPSNYTNYEGLVNKALLLSGDSLAEHIICPALVDKNDWDENQGDDGHDGQRIL